MTPRAKSQPVSSCRLAVALALGLAFTAPLPLSAQVTSAFSYQGELRTGGNPANASFDMEFRLYNAASSGTQIGPLVTRLNVSAANGLFSVQLDFGPAQFAGDRQWLEVRIKPAGSGSYETLSPRTEVTATPYALGAVAALPNSVTTTSLVDATVQGMDIAPGAVGTAQIASAQVQRRVSGSCAGSQGMQSIAADGSVSCGSFAGGDGTVTSVGTGAGLTGGPVTTSGTISVAPGGIGATEIDGAQVQRRVTGSCAGANFVQQIGEDGSVACAPAGAASGWSLSGNAGTNPGINFIGTTDAQSFVVRTQNEPSLRIEPNVGNGGVVITSNTLGGSSANSLTPGVRGATIGGGGVPTGDSDPDLASGSPNRITDHYGTVGGGFGNRAGDDAEPLFGAPFATVGGGRGNTASGNASTVGGGWSNAAGDSLSSVGGGFFNNASANSSSVGGGQFNNASGPSSAIAGGRSNTASAADSTVGGGASNNATEILATIAGGLQNGAGAYAAVGGGEGNLATGSHSVVTGGRNNAASGLRSSVGGGNGNIANNDNSIVGGGQFNLASGIYSTVDGGENNTASGAGSTVSGGGFNTATGAVSAIVGGRANSALGNSSTVSGGVENCAGADLSWAGGVRAKVRPGQDPGGGLCGGLTYPGGLGDQGTFVWAGLQYEDFVSTGPGQFLVRASGGIYFGTNSIVSIPAGRFINTSTGAYLTSGGTWTNASSRTLKTGFAPVDVADTLSRVLSLPLTRWEYRASPQEGEHLGPVAEDFHAAFGLGADGQSISTTDASGVALAAIKGLNAKLEAENAALRAELAAQRAWQARLAAEFAELQTRLRTGEER